MKQKVKNFINSELGVMVIILVAAAFLSLYAFSEMFMLGVVPTESMEPTIKVNEMVLCNRRWPSINRGDIVVFHEEEGSSKWLIKRVIGLPGETVELEGYTTKVNGEVLDEKYVTYAVDEPYQKFEIGEGEYLLLGDNRANSKDARSTGELIKESNIMGRELFHFKSIWLYCLIPVLFALIFLFRDKDQKKNEIQKV